jgi:hypothetical protein
MGKTGALRVVAALDERGDAVQVTLFFRPAMDRVCIALIGGGASKGVR